MADCPLCDEPNDGPTLTHEVGACLARLRKARDTARRERDEARAEVDRLREALRAIAEKRSGL